MTPFKLVLQRTFDANPKTYYLQFGGAREERLRAICHPEYPCLPDQSLRTEFS